MLNTSVVSEVSRGLLLYGMLACFSAVSASEAVRTALDNQWEEHMFQGDSIASVNGVTLREIGASYSSFDGKVDHVWASDRGIRLDSLNETEWGGLFTRGGWRLEGGLLSVIGVSDGTLELYGKSRWNVEPQLFHFGKTPPRSARHSYDFFLLLRPKEGERAEIIKKWHISDDQLPYDYYLRGQIQSIPGGKVVTVLVTGVSDGKEFIRENISR